MSIHTASIMNHSATIPFLKLTIFKKLLVINGYMPAGSHNYVYHNHYQQFMRNIRSDRNNSWPLAFFNIWLTKIHFGQPVLLYIFNGMTINYLQNVHVLSSKKTVNQSLTLISTTDTCNVLWIYSMVTNSRIYTHWWSIMP